ncbi:MAG: hypothetical protein JXQ73_27085 [Phycisphaerae bacterium]|nr:hypothetical protein [Phycisphaerae bacterium]
MDKESPMFYAAMTFWLLVIVFVAWGVHQLWSGMVRPRVVNSILLPGTLLAQLGRIVGVLVTGGTVNNTTLMKDDEAGEPQTDQKPQPKIPIVGSILVAMLPLVACATGIYWATQMLGGEIIGKVADQTVTQKLPMSLAAFWALLRDSISLVERMVDGILRANLIDWKSIAFLYLVICLTVRMAPLPGNLRGSLGAIVLVGLAIALLGSAAPSTVTALKGSWPILSFSVGVLLLLLMITLIVRGVVGLIRVLSRNG